MRGKWEKKKIKKPRSEGVVSRKGLYTLEVALYDGPITRKFAKANPVVARTIRIRGDQTLEHLHYAIFDSFEREEEHMYEFQVGGKGPHDEAARCYVLPQAYDRHDPGQARGGDLTRTTIAALRLQVGDVFGYWFDYGDDWWHQINVLAIDEAVPKGKYPRVTARVGASPPQYINWDEE